MLELQLAITWLRARLEIARRDESGASAVEWLLIIIGAAGICAAAIAAVSTYVNTQNGKLNK